MRTCVDLSGYYSRGHADPATVHAFTDTKVNTYNFNHPPRRMEARISRQS